MLKKILIGFILAIIILLIGRFIQVSTDSQYDGERKPYIQSLSSNSVVIKWQTAQASNNQLFYGTQAGKLDLVAGDTTQTLKHELLLADLQADTRYYFALNQQHTDPNQWFKTQVAPQSNAPVRLWVMGDTGVAGKKQQQVKHAALQWMQQNPLNNNTTNANLWLLLGDIAYRSGTQEQYQKALFEAYADVIKNTAIWPVYGNHDDRRWSYFDIFTLPEQGQTGGLASNTENYFAIDYANVHVLILDSQASSLKPDGDMATWIKQDLANTKAQWIIAAFHHPPYTDGGHDSDNRSDSDGKMALLRENIIPILEENGVDLVLTGHSHGYERSDLIQCHYGDSPTFSKQKHTPHNANPSPNQYQKPDHSKQMGTMYIVTGSASKMDRADYQHPALPYSFQEYGSLILDINNNQLSGHFINEKGDIIDRFNISKRDDLAKTQSGCH